MSKINSETLLRMVAKGRFTADLVTTVGTRVGQEKTLKKVQFEGGKLVAEDVTFFGILARVQAIVIMVDGMELTMIDNIVDSASMPAGGDLLVPLSGGFIGEM